MHSEYNAGEDVDVVVTGRIVEESICEGTCKFQYKSSETVYVEVPETLEYLAGANVTIQRANNSDISNAEVEVGGVVCQINSNNNTHLEFVYPAIPSGRHEVEITVGDAKTYPSIITTTPLYLYFMNKRNGSEEGHRILFYAQGLPNEEDKV